MTYHKIIAACILTASPLAAHADITLSDMTAKLTTCLVAKEADAASDYCKGLINGVALGRALALTTFTPPPSQLSRSTIGGSLGEYPRIGTRRQGQGFGGHANKPVPDSQFGIESLGLGSAAPNPTLDDHLGVDLPPLGNRFGVEPPPFGRQPAISNPFELGPMELQKVLE